MNNDLQQIINQYIEENFPQCYLVDCKIHLGKQNYVELAIDKDGGISLDDCIQINKQLRNHLETEKYPDFQNYELDVASPGLGNPLKLKRQYQNHIGKLLNINLTNGQNLKGNLIELQQEELTLEIKNQNKHTHKIQLTTKTIPFMEIQETKVEVSF